LKYHRLKPGGVSTGFGTWIAMKLKYHRLKPGGVATRTRLAGTSY